MRGVRHRALEHDRVVDRFGPDTTAGIDLADIALQTVDVLMNLDPAVEQHGILLIDGINCRRAGALAHDVKHGRRFQLHIGDIRIGNEDAGSTAGQPDDDAFADVERDPARRWA